MKTYTYKTLKGLFNTKKVNNITIYEIFTDNIYYYDNGIIKRLIVCNELKQEIAKGFADWFVSSRIAKKRLVYGLTNKVGDLSYVQCFHVSKNGRFSTSLSGESHEYCKRMYLKSVKI
jgi:hypothetical protein